MSEQAALHSLWRKGYTNPKGLTVPCASLSNARRLRWTLYNSVSKYRGGIGREQADPDLLEAIDNCALGVEVNPDGTYQLRIRKKVETEMMEAVLAALGDTPVRSAEDMMIEQSQQKLAELLKREEPQEERDPNLDRARAVDRYFKSPGSV